MKTMMRALMVIAALTVPALAVAAGSPQTRGAMASAGCFACHAVNHKVVGPAYSWIAYVFAHKPGARLTLARKIITGGAGRWNPWTGGIPMVAHPGLSLPQAERMADWVLAQAPVAPPKP